MILTHPFPPIVNENSKTLILGSFPSVKSREALFYYGNARNRFWLVLSRVFGEEPPVTTEQKTRFVLSHSLALWDVVFSCEIHGSADVSIKNAVANDIGRLIDDYGIKKIFTNGKKADKLYIDLVEKTTGIKSVSLPSTSPANAAFSLEDLTRYWKAISE